MKTVYKYKIELLYCASHLASISMPQGAKILKVCEQLNEIMIWAEVDDKNQHEERYFHIYGTGHEVIEDDSS